MQVIRNYVHRTYGTIGQVTLEAPDADWTLNGKPLSAGSVEHLLTFSLQTLQDAYAGADNEAEAVGAFNGKLDRLIAGTIGVRGEAADPLVSEMRSAIRAVIRKRQPDLYKSIKDMDAKDAAARLDQALATLRDAKPDAYATLEADAKAELKRKVETAAKRAKLDVDVSL